MCGTKAKKGVKKGWHLFLKKSEISVPISFMVQKYDFSCNVPAISANKESLGENEELDRCKKKKKEKEKEKEKRGSPVGVGVWGDVLDNARDLVVSPVEVVFSVWGPLPLVGNLHKSCNVFPEDLELPLCLEDLLWIVIETNVTGMNKKESSQHLVTHFNINDLCDAANKVL